MELIDLVAQKLFEETINEENPKEYLNKNFKELMGKFREEFGFKKLSKGGFISKYKGAKNKAEGMILSQPKRKK
ncbi:MAG: hypothetical protein WC089_01340 [Candidatus Paceibacterota bacterium]